MWRMILLDEGHQRAAVARSAPHAKAHSVPGTSRKDPRVRLSVRTSYRMRFSVQHGLQNALFRRVRFSSPGQTSSRLTQKRILCVGPHGKAHSACWASRKGALCPRHSRRMRLSVRSDPKPKFGDPGATRPAAWRAVARARLPSWATFHSAPRPGGRLPCAPLRAAT